MTHNIPGVPTDEEKKQLVEFLLRNEDPELYDEGRVDAEYRQEKQEVVKEACIAVFDNYATYTPGYSGKAMIVIWPAGLEYTQAYTWYRDGSKEYLVEEPINP